MLSSHPFPPPPFPLSTVSSISIGVTLITEWSYSLPLVLRSLTSVEVEFKLHSLNRPRPHLLFQLKYAVKILYHLPRIVSQYSLNL